MTSSMAVSEREAWLTLATTAGVGPETFYALLAALGSATEILRHAAAGRLRRELALATTGDETRRRLPAPTLNAIEHWPDTAGSRLKRIGELGLWSSTPLDADYPVSLLELDPPPPFLLGSGEREVLAWSRAVAVVGTRRPTPGGRWLAARISQRLVECQASVVSGLAIGIDGVAHATTIERGGRTLAVIGGGHDNPGPRAHERLRESILASGGAIVSEHAPDVAPTKGTYPRRNRIIAALAEATVVVEAPARSGALITARHALELGRPVFAAPGRVGEWATAGTLALLRETPARVLAGVDELIDDLGYLAAPVAAVAADPADQGGSAAVSLLSGAERAVADRVRRAPVGLDGLVADTGLAPSVVAGAVTLLLMRGWLQPVGPAYVAAGPLLR